MDKTEIFEKAPVHKAVINMAVPTILSMIVIILYNMADTFFVGQTGNSLYVSAVSLASPVFLIFTAFTSMFGAGGSSVISRALGKGDPERAKKVSAFVCYASIIFGVLMSAVVLIGMEPLLKFLGTDADTHDLVKEYLIWIGLGATFSIFSGAFSNIIRSEGRVPRCDDRQYCRKHYQYHPGPGHDFVAGSGRPGGGDCYCDRQYGGQPHLRVLFLLEANPALHHAQDFRPTGRLTWDIISIGIPSAATSLLATLANVLMNRTLVAYGNNAVAGMGVAMKVNTVAVYILLGLGTGIQPLIGYNYGSGNQKRLMGIFKFSSLASVVLGSVITAVMVILRTPIIRAFIPDQEVVDYGTQMLVALQMAGPIVGLVFIGANTIQAMGKALAAFILNLLRQGIFLIPTIFILDHFFGLSGVVYSNPLADYLAVVVSYIVCIKYMKQMGKPGRSS